ncbi:MAG: hypothetical protein K0S53_3153 [Bacteroidetes bacterium]|nr:hypothetical protein [Bacteroidota bacterium]
MNDDKEIIIRIAEVTEILTTPPKWLFRWGITIIFLTIVIGIILSYLIKYPDTLTASATISSINSPIIIISKNGGKLSHLKVFNNQFVAANQVLAVIENPADYNDVLKLDNNLNNLKSQIKSNDCLSGFCFSDNLKLGELTTTYLLFLKSYSDLKLFSEINPQKQDILTLNKELIYYTALLTKFQKQGYIYQEQSELIEKDYMRYLNLFQNQEISTGEFEEKKKVLLVVHNKKENQNIVVRNTKIAINKLEKQIIQLKIQFIGQNNKLKTETEQNIEKLRSEISSWKEQYLLVSSVAGKVIFLSDWIVNQNIETSVNVFKIVPTGKEQIIAKLILPSFNSDKVKINQQVCIKLYNYPVTEYGHVKGIIKNICIVPKENSYSIDVELPNRLKTSHHRELLYKDEMIGTADIITGNLSVLERLIMKFRKITP